MLVYTKKKKHLSLAECTQVREIDKKVNIITTAEMIGRYKAYTSKGSTDDKIYK